MLIFISFFLALYLGIISFVFFAKQNITKGTMENNKILNPSINPEQNKPKNEEFWKQSLTDRWQYYCKLCPGLAFQDSISNLSNNLLSKCTDSMSNLSQKTNVLSQESIDPEVRANLQFFSVN